MCNCVNSEAWDCRFEPYNILIFFSFCCKRPLIFYSFSYSSQEPVTGQGSVHSVIIPELREIVDKGSNKPLPRPPDPGHTWPRAALTGLWLPPLL